MLAVHKVKVYSVGTKSRLLPEQLVEVEFEGNTIKDLLTSIGSRPGKTLYDEMVAEDGSFRYGYSIAVNGEVFRADELDQAVPNLSEVVVIHLMQIPAGG